MIDVEGKFTLNDVLSLLLEDINIYNRKEIYNHIKIKDEYKKK